MKIITDSREQRNQHILQEFSKQNISFKVKRLNFGDYSISGYEDKIMIERKAHLTELAGCFCQGRKRFEAEFIRASEAGAQIYLLIEDDKAKEKIILRRKMDKYIKKTTVHYTTSHNEKKIEYKYEWADNQEFDEYTLKKVHDKTWKSNFLAHSMIASLESWIKKYNINLVFCKKKDTGKKIIEIFENYIQNQ